MTNTTEAALHDLTRPIVGIENRTAQEAFDIMADRIRHKFAALSQPSPASEDTVAFVQEWLMSGGHEPDQWHKDFAAAIDARCASPSSGEPASVAPTLADAVECFLADYDDGDRADAGTNPLMAAHIADFRAAISASVAVEVDQ